MKNCKRGYPCGGSCISISYACRKEFPEGVSVTINGLRQVIQNKINPPKLERRLTKEEIKKEIEKVPAPPEEPKKQYGSFTLPKDFESYKKTLKRIGKGTDGEVYLDEKNNVIIKAPIKQANKYEEAVQRNAIANEIKVLKELSNTGVTPKFLDADPEKGIIAMSYEGGTPISKIKKLTLEENKNLIKAFSVLHKMGYAHGDPHHNNILIKPDGKAILIDFGYSSNSNNTRLRTEIVSSPQLNPNVYGRKAPKEVKKAFNKAKKVFLANAVKSDLSLQENINLFYDSLFKDLNIK